MAVRMHAPLILAAALAASLAALAAACTDDAPIPAPAPAPTTAPATPTPTPTATPTPTRRMRPPRRLRRRRATPTATPEATATPDADADARPTPEPTPEPTPGPSMRYGAFDPTGEAAEDGRYAFITGEPGARRAVATYEELRTASSIVRFNLADAEGVSQAAVLAEVEVGDVFEWRHGDTCWARYRVTSAPAPPLDAVSWEFGVRWATYAYSGCKGPLAGTLAATVTWHPLDVRSSAIASPVRHGPYLIQPNGWEGGDLEPLARVGPEPDTLLGGASDLESLRQHPFWREPEFPGGWSFLTGTFSPERFEGYRTHYLDARGGIGADIWVVRPRHLPVAYTAFSSMSVWETTTIDGHPAVIRFNPTGDALPFTVASAFDEETGIIYSVTGMSPRATGSPDLVITAVRSLLPPKPPCEQDHGTLAADTAIEGEWAAICRSAERGTTALDGSMFHTFTLDARAMVTLELASDAGDAGLVLRRGAGREGAPLEEDAARIRLPLDAGTYTVEAARRPGAAGAYTLAIGLVEPSAMSYPTFDTTGEAATPGSYAILTGEGAERRAVATYEELRTEATAVRFNLADGDDVRRAAAFDDVEVGDVVEWRAADDCWARYQVTSIAPPAAGAAPREFGVRWVTYAYRRDAPARCRGAGRYGDRLASAALRSHTVNVAGRASRRLPCGTARGSSPAGQGALRRSTRGISPTTPPVAGGARHIAHCMPLRPISRARSNTRSGRSPNCLRDGSFTASRAWERPIGLLRHVRERAWVWRRPEMWISVRPWAGHPASSPEMCCNVDEAHDHRRPRRVAVACTRRGASPQSLAPRGSSTTRRGSVYAVSGRGPAARGDEPRRR